MQLNSQFTTREEYIQFRSEWRAQYKALSQEIRQLRRETVEAQRAGDGSYEQSKLAMRRFKAASMMHMLEKAKERRDGFLALKAGKTEQVA